MTRLLLLVIASLSLFALPVPIQAAFSSMYVFGDGVSTITNNVSPNAGTLYYDNRYCNGRVWVEVLAQRQGLTLATNQNLSYYGHDSSNLVVNVGKFVAPSDVAAALFVVWVADADFVLYLGDTAYRPYDSTKIGIWTDAINQSVSNHLTAVQTLYDKGVRTLVMPNAVDVTKVPFYNRGVATNGFVRQQIISFNGALAAALAQFRGSHPDLAIVSPDFFKIEDDLLARPAVYGFTNVIGDVIDDEVDLSLNGPGTNYVFWDYLDPTAKVQEILADTTQAQLLPATIAMVGQVNGTNQLTVVNLPIGLNGFVDRSTNFTAWSQAQAFSSSNATQTLQVPVSGPIQFYRLRFPFAWTWP